MSTDVRFYFDAEGNPSGMRIFNLDSTRTSVINDYRYFFVTNVFGDVIEILNSSGNRVVEYTYSAFGSPTIKNITGSTESALAIQYNPFMYRGYFYDHESGFYYLNARYYNPEWGRFISMDDISYLTADGVDNANLYVYCRNNPIMYQDDGGHWVETVFDLFSLGASVVEVVVNPANPWAWAGLIGDAVDLLPFVTCVGEGIRATKMVKYADEVIDVSHSTIKFVKAADNAADFVDDGLDIARALDKTADGFTVSNRLAGIRIHKTFMGNGEIIGGGRFRVDGLNAITKTVFELKPYNISSARRGIKQILNYNDVLGGAYRMTIVLY